MQYGLIGSMLLRRGAHDEAAAVFQKALELSPNDAGIQKNLVRSLLAQKNPRRRSRFSRRRRDRRQPGAARPKRRSKSAIARTRAGPRSRRSRSTRGTRGRGCCFRVCGFPKDLSTPRSRPSLLSSTPPWPDGFPARRELRSCRSFPRSRPIRGRSPSWRKCATPRATRRRRRSCASRWRTKRSEGERSTRRSTPTEGSLPPCRVNRRPPRASPRSRRPSPKGKTKRRPRPLRRRGRRPFPFRLRFRLTSCPRSKSRSTTHRLLRHPSRLRPRAVQRVVRHATPRSRRSRRSSSRSRSSRSTG